VTGGLSSFYRGRSVLVTNGTYGLGLATALAFAEHGATLVLTHAAGRANKAEVKQRFAAAGVEQPLSIAADIGNRADIASLYATISEQRAPIEVLVGNPSPASFVDDLGDYTEEGFVAALRATTWSVVECTLAGKRYLGRYPRYVVILSSDAADRFVPGHDFAACSQAASDALSRYLCYRLRGEDVRINTVRTHALEIEPSSAFGGALHRLAPDGWRVPEREVASAVFALCSGMFDAMTGQLLTVDRGNAFVDGISLLYERREMIGL
jgi:NAD(P)-dependent dehydrogenase (short-subunit alcohol dehydrogenase family)